MQMIFTHEDAGFDAVASLIAATRLYPGAPAVVPRAVTAGAAEFLALHERRLRPLSLDEIDADAVHRIILVATRRLSNLGVPQVLWRKLRAGELSAGLHIYDHHAGSPDDLQGAVSLVEPVGATSTLLVEALQTRRLAVNSVEATLLALGIYSATASLSQPSTTPRDLRAAAWLLERGASLNVVHRYVRGPLSPGQRRLLTRLLQDMEVVVVPELGLEIAFGALGDGGGEGVQADLERVVHHALCISGAPLLFVTAATPSGLLVHGRSRTSDWEVGQALRALGGVGDAACGRATLPSDRTSASVRDWFLAWFQQHRPRPRLVRHVMTSPVTTVDAHTPVHEVRRMLRAQRIRGAPVLRKWRITGVIDVARLDGDGGAEVDPQAPVESYMAHGARTIAPDASCEAALELMVESGADRLPVVDRGHVVGIITRSDLLRHLYGAEPPPAVPS